MNTPNFFPKFLSTSRNISLPGVSLLALVATVLLSCSSTKESEAQATAQAAQSKTNSAPPSVIVGIARIEPEDGIVALYSSASGKIKTLVATRNIVLEKGQNILLLDDDVDEAQIRQVSTKSATQESSILAAKASADALRVSLENARKTYLLNEQLLAAKAISAQALSDSKAALDKLEQDYKQVLASADQSTLRLKEFQADAAYYQTLRAQKRVQAPYKGKVLSWDVHVGDVVTSSSKLGDFAPEGSIVAVTEVDELFAEYVKKGLKATIQSQSSGKIIGHGEVTFVADYLKKKSLFEDATSTEDRRVREVHIRLDNGSEVLIGGRVDCTIQVR
jgi:HlyD family secretion protein